VAGGAPGRADAKVSMGDDAMDLATGFICLILINYGDPESIARPRPARMHGLCTSRSRAFAFCAADAEGGAGRARRRVRGPRRQGAAGAGGPAQRAHAPVRRRAVPPRDGRVPRRHRRPGLPRHQPRGDRQRVRHRRLPRRRQLHAHRVRDRRVQSARHVRAVPAPGARPAAASACPAVVIWAAPESALLHDLERSCSECACDCPCGTFLCRAPAAVRMPAY